MFLLKCNLPEEVRLSSSQRTSNAIGTLWGPINYDENEDKDNDNDDDDDDDDDDAAFKKHVF